MKNQFNRISLFYCSNSLSAEEIASLNNKIKDVTINQICLPCSGKVNLLYLLKAIETGSDGVILASCKLGGCKFLQGNFRAQKRIESIDDLLFETGVGRGRVKFVSMNETNKIDMLITAINELTETFRIEFKEKQE